MLKMMKNNFNQTKAERIVYKNSKLYIFKWNAVFVIQGTPLRAWGKSNLLPRWINTIPPDRVFNLRAMAKKAAHAVIETEKENSHQIHLKMEGEAIKQFTDQVPSDIRDRISKYRNQHWRLLAFALRCDGAKEMILNDEQPVFPYLYACNKLFINPVPTKPIRTARRLLRLTRRKSLEVLGYPSTKSTVKVLSKISDPYELSIESLACLQQLLWDPSQFKQISHLPTINSTIIEIMSNEILKQSITPNFLEEVASTAREKRFDIPHYLRDTMEMVKLLRLLNIPIFKSSRDLSKMHHDLTHMINSGRIDTDLRLGFPPPPVPEKEGVITAIRDTKMLNHEATSMSNCVKSYAKRIVLERTHFLYHIEYPLGKFSTEKATMSLVRREDGCWCLDQIKGPHNRNVSKKTHDLVRSWLDENHSNMHDNPFYSDIYDIVG